MDFFGGEGGSSFYVWREYQWWDIKKRKGSVWIDGFLVFHILFSATTGLPCCKTQQINCVGVWKKVGQWAWVPQPLTWLQSNGVGENNRLSGWWMPSLLSLLLFISGCSCYFFPVCKILVKFLILISVKFFKVFKLCFNCIKNELLLKVLHV